MVLMLQDLFRDKVVLVIHRRLDKKNIVVYNGTAFQNSRKEGVINVLP